MSAKQRKELAEAVKTIQQLLADAYHQSDDACFEIRHDGVTLIGEESGVLLTQVAPELAISELIDDSRK